MNQELINTVKHLIDTACHYSMDELATLYATDLQIIIVQKTGDVLSFDYEQNLAFFRTLREQNTPPINTAVSFQHADIQDGMGYVIATRHMDLGQGEQQIVFTLMLRRTADNWQVFREHAVVA